MVTCVFLALDIYLDPLITFTLHKEFPFQCNCLPKWKQTNKTKQNRTNKHHHLHHQQLQQHSNNNKMKMGIQKNNLSQDCTSSIFFLPFLFVLSPVFEKSPIKQHVMYIWENLMLRLKNANFQMISENKKVQRNAYLFWHGHSTQIFA